MDRFAPIACLVLASAIGSSASCDCGTPTGDIEADERERLRVPDVHDGTGLPPDQRRQVAELIARIRPYYPTWDPAREDVDDFHARYHDAPETLRYLALIDERELALEVTWRALLRDVREVLGRGFTVLHGTPPKFYVPSLQIVILGQHPRGKVAMIYRLSMLAPVWDFYQDVRGRDGRVSQRTVAATRHTAHIDRRVRELIAERFPAYRELPPPVSQVLVPRIQAGLQMVGKATIANALFEDLRRAW